MASKAFKNNCNVSGGHLLLGDCAPYELWGVLGSITNQLLIIGEGHAGWCCHVVTLGHFLHERMGIVL
jgi:hypothetical protein